MLSISIYRTDSQELAGQLRFHCGMERDGSVEMDWNQARLSSMKVGMKLNGLVEVPMRWSMSWTFFDDEMPNTFISTSQHFERVKEQTRLEFRSVQNPT